MHRNLLPGDKRLVLALRGQQGGDHILHRPILVERPRQGPERYGVLFLRIAVVGYDLQLAVCDAGAPTESVPVIPPAYRELLAGPEDILGRGDTQVVGIDALDNDLVAVRCVAPHVEIRRGIVAQVDLVVIEGPVFTDTDGDIARHGGGFAVDTVGRVRNGADAPGEVLVLVVRGGEGTQRPGCEVGIGELQLRALRREAVLPERRAGGGGIAGQDMDQVRIFKVVGDPHRKVDLRGQAAQDEAARRGSGDGQRLHPGEEHGIALHEALRCCDGRHVSQQLRFAHLPQIAASIGHGIDAVGVRHQLHGGYHRRHHLSVADQAIVIVDKEI